MLRTLLESIPGLSDPRLLVNALGFAILVLVGGVLWLRSRSRNEGQDGSFFRTREADQIDPLAQKKRGPGDDPLAHARIKPKPRPMALPGIRIDGAPHEVLGISPRATRDEIQVAWRELMKRYHPDKVGRPGTREWKDAQKIAEAINHAKDELLKKSGK